MHAIFFLALLPLVTTADDDGAGAGAALLILVLLTPVERGRALKVTAGLWAQ